jgi:hypothetical protein
MSDYVPEIDFDIWYIVECYNGSISVHEDDLRFLHQLYRMRKKADNYVIQVKHMNLLPLSIALRRIRSGYELSNEQFKKYEYDFKEFGCHILMNPSHGLY